jgi:hypothetical protein
MARLPRGPKMDMNTLLGLTLAGLAYQNREGIGKGLGKGFNWIKGLFGKGGEEAAGVVTPGSFDETNPMNLDMQDSYDPLNPDNLSQDSFMEELGESWDPSNPFNEELPGGMGWNQSDIGFDDMSFKQAFRTNRNAGVPTFTWRGNEYTTELAEDAAQTGNKGFLDQMKDAAHYGPRDSSSIDNFIDDWQQAADIENFKSAAHYGDPGKSSWQNFKDDWSNAWSPITGAKRR